MTDQMTLEFTNDAKLQINRMISRAMRASYHYPHDADTQDAIRNCLQVINQVIQLGGRITAPPVDSTETMILNGWNGFIQYGVVIHDSKLPTAYAHMENSDDWPLLYAYGVHS